MSETPEHLTQEYLDRVRVVPAAPFGGRIALSEYDPGWPGLFEREAARIRGALGAAALEVEHVGSTSVPGLAAKPIIDIDLVVPDSADEPAYVPALEAAGYVLTVREPDWYEHRLFKGPDTNVNLHVFGPGTDEHHRHLLFRDRMREHPEDRDAYEAAKRELSEREWPSVQHYADAKSAVVHEVLARAGWVEP